MRIAITGIGIVSVLGMGEAATLKALLDQQSGIGQMRYLPSSHKELPVGEVKMSNAEMACLLGISNGELHSRTSLMGALAVRDALADARCEVSALGNAVLINGTTVGGMDITEAHFAEMMQGTDSSKYINHHSCGHSTDDIARMLGLGVRTCTVSNACASALNAIILGAEMLKAGEADLVIVGGSEALSLFHLNGFNTLMILDHERCRPFDATRQGLNLGEGAAFLVLEDEEAALARGIRVRAYITGYANACDAFHQTATSENGDGAYLAMTAALQMAELKPENIDYVNAHGTGTINNDASETAALKRVFTENIPTCSSTKSFTGHTTSASGSIETVITLLAMENGFVPSNLGWEHPMPEGFRPSTGNERKVITYALCNSFGFGGNDASLVLQSSTVQCSTFQVPSYNAVANDSVLTTHCGASLEVAADVTINSAEQLKESKEYIAPMEARRMGRLLRATTMSSLKALKEAGVTMPDAIITATDSGMLETSEQFLTDLCENGEQLLKPTLFMQSTHNTLGCAIAIRLKCHGYNLTYSHGPQSLDWALADAKRLILMDKARTVLVIHSEEVPTGFAKITGKSESFFSRSIVLRKK